MRLIVLLLIVAAATCALAWACWNDIPSPDVESFQIQEPIISDGRIIGWRQSTDASVKSDLKLLGNICWHGDIGFGSTIVDIPAPGFEHLGKNITAHGQGDYYLAGELRPMPDYKLLSAGGMITQYRNIDQLHVDLECPWRENIRLHLPNLLPVTALNVYRNDDNTLVGWIPVVVPERKNEPMTEAERRRIMDTPW